jgi:hypothetical protein
MSRLTFMEAADICGMLRTPVPDRQQSPDEGLSRAEWQERLDDFNSDLYGDDDA